MVEQNRSGTYTQIVYSPGGAKLALMGGQTLQTAFVPLPGQATAVYTSSGLDHYRHSDWLGSARLTSSPSRAVLSTTAYAPFGEPYAQSGTADLSFTGQNQDTVSGDYDFLYREYSTQGRWPSPDPAGLAAADPTNPQSWNRYAYVLNNPLALVDPQGLDCAYGGSYVNGAIGQYSAASGASCSSVGNTVCIVDGVDTPCGMALNLISSGAAAVCPNNDCTNWSLKTNLQGNSVFVPTFMPIWVAQNMSDGCSGFTCVLSFNAVVPADDSFQPGSLAYEVFGPPSYHTWNGATNLVNAGAIYTGAGITLVVSAPVAVEGAAVINEAAAPYAETPLGQFLWRWAFGKQLYAAPVLSTAWKTVKWAVNGAESAAAASNANGGVPY
jgi:RHS repeat-associated protein